MQSINASLSTLDTLRNQGVVCTNLLFEIKSETDNILQMIVYVSKCVISKYFM